MLDLPSHYVVSYGDCMPGADKSGSSYISVIQEIDYGSPRELPYVGLEYFEIRINYF